MQLKIVQILNPMLWGRQAWDAPKEVPIIQDEQKQNKLFRFIEFVVCTFVGLLVFALAFFSKTSLLLLISIGNKNAMTITVKPYAHLFMGCLLIAPNVLILIKSIWKIAFKGLKTPSWQTLLWVVLVEALVALGSSVLTLVAMPNFDVLTNVMLLNGVATLSAVLQVVANSLGHGRRRFTMISVASVIFLIAGYIVFAINYMKDGGMSKGLFVGLAIGGTTLVSLSWWENYAMLFHIVFFNNTIRDIKKSRNLVSILASLVRIAVTAIVLGLYVKISKQEWSSVLNVPTSTKTLVLSLFFIQVLSSALCRWMTVMACKMHAVRRSFAIPMIFVSPAVLVAFVLAVWISYWNFDPNTPLCSSTLEVQFNVIFTNSSGITFSDYVTGFFGEYINNKFTEFLNSIELPCNAIIMQNLNTLASNYSGTFAEYCNIFERFNISDLTVMNNLLIDLTQEVCIQSVYTGSSVSGYVLLSISLICWWFGLVLCTFYIWFFSIHRIERTKDMFVRNLYEAAFIDQSMLLNTRFEVLHNTGHHREMELMHINLCATMWHETYDEMIKMIISMFRLDKFRPKKCQFNDVTFESHIYFDDAFLKKDNERHVNEYAETLVEVIREIYILFTNEGGSMFEKKKQLPDQKIIKTPYGCRLQYTLPQGNTLFIHFKDKKCIRHKKRWSQIMYLYYLLGWKLNTKYYKLYKDDDEPLRTIDENLKKEKENTYILALDGDTDFQPSAVMLLVDRLRMYPEVGAACGRIHPTGTGPMVWYQKFEYAVGHWLQKTAEHVFGCVLCSPGCFSLFRAAALMDDNVMKRYTTKPSEAIHYVQYDQGEDRWLCTLLLQQGWRVEYSAASDSYTNAPQEFKEFYNQRRRWGPSTMANTLDLLSSGTLTAQRNKSISRLYILFQIGAMASSLLGPATVCLMIAGCFSFIFKINPNLALVLAIVPPAVYMSLCFYLGQGKSDLQISIAAFMSIFYAFLMTASILSIIGDMVMEGTFLTPTGVFFVGISAMYVITAILHPNEFHLIIYGLLYIISIPSGYLLLSIYSMVNMNNVSWGTRESGSQGNSANTHQKNVKCQKLLSVCGYNLEIQLSQDVKVRSTTPLTPAQEDAPRKDEAQAAASKGEERHPSSTEDRFIQQLKDCSAELTLKEDFLNEDEEQFWKDLIERYLKPLEADKAKEERIKTELKSLRNKATFVFFIANCLWLVATFFLQAIGGTLSIRVPKLSSNGSETLNGNLYIDPIGLMFLIGFAAILVIQFCAMLWHRIQTLIHFIAYSGTEAVISRKMGKSQMFHEMISDENDFL